MALNMWSTASTRCSRLQRFHHLLNSIDLQFLDTEYRSSCNDTICQRFTFLSLFLATNLLQALGHTDTAIDLASLGPLHIATIDKTLFSMLTPEVKGILSARPHIKNVIVMGIEVYASFVTTRPSQPSLRPTSVSCRPRLTCLLLV